MAKEREPERRDEVGGDDLVATEGVGVLDRREAGEVVGHEERGDDGPGVGRERHLALPAPGEGAQDRGIPRRAGEEERDHAPSRTRVRTTRAAHGFHHR